MLWKLLIIVLVLEIFGMFFPLPIVDIIHFFLFFTLTAVFMCFSQWLLSALEDIDQLLKLSIYKN